MINEVTLGRGPDRCATCGQEHTEGGRRCETCGSPLVPARHKPWRKRRRRPTGTAQEATGRAEEA